MHLLRHHQKENGGCKAKRIREIQWARVVLSEFAF